MIDFSDVDPDPQRSSIWETAWIRIQKEKLKYKISFFV